MKKLTIVTGNPDKLREIQRLVPDDYKIANVDLDLVEIQSVDPLEIATDKAKRAYEHVRKPIIVEDISAGLDELQNLPGPFYKFFEKKLGKGALYILAGNKKAPATITALYVYYNGAQIIVGKGEIHGTVVAPREGTGFGFDFVFVPDGYDQTFSEMGPEGKDKISHRKLAIEDLLSQLEQL